MCWQERRAHERGASLSYQNPSFTLSTDGKNLAVRVDGEEEFRIWSDNSLQMAANRIKATLTTGEEFDYKLIRRNFSQVLVIFFVWHGFSQQHWKKKIFKDVHMQWEQRNVSKIQAWINGLGISRSGKGLGHTIVSMRRKCLTQRSKIRAETLKRGRLDT